MTFLSQYRTNWYSKPVKPWQEKHTLLIQYHSMLFHRIWKAQTPKPMGLAAGSTTLTACLMVKKRLLMLQIHTSLMLNIPKEYQNYTNLDDYINI